MTPRAARASAEWPGAEAWVPEHGGVTDLRDAAPSCRGCDLYREATQVVMGDGPSDAEIMLVGEQPGDSEDREGLPFVGPAGRLLDSALEAAGIDPDSVFRTNAVKHFRFEHRGGKRIHKSPVRWQVAACEPWLLAELEAVGPQVLVLLGATAGQAVYGPSFRVGAQRGRRLDWPQARSGQPGAPEAVLATAHPSSVLRSRRRAEDLDALIADLTVARSLLP